ncbi:MAG: MurR/RpiR family transcriptional regulator [Lactimicrobium sp.]|uniref:MurR/RpiR family transcriptional regulator n=1 Tax=Lactimicrobium sp. TaxID=2563780 RepID=UPI002F34FDD9
MTEIESSGQNRYNGGMTTKINLKDEAEKKRKDPNVSLAEKLTDTTFASDTFQTISAFLLANYQKVPDMSVRQLADVCYVSQGTIVRFAKKLGYHGYRDLQNDLIRQSEAQKYVSQDVNFKQPFDTSKAMAQEIVSSMASLYRESIDIIQTAIHPMQLQRMAQRLNRSAQILLVGTGDTEITCLQFANRIAKLGCHVQMTTMFGDQSLILANAKSDDTVIIASYSGDYFDSFHSTLKQLKSTGTAIFAMTAKADSWLIPYANETVIFPDLEGKREERIGTFYSQLAIGYVLNLLYSFLYAYHQAE